MSRQATLTNAKRVDALLAQLRQQHAQSRESGPARAERLSAAARRAALVHASPRPSDAPHVASPTPAQRPPQTLATRSASHVPPATHAAVPALGPYGDVPLVGARNTGMRRDAVTSYHDPISDTFDEYEEPPLAASQPLPRIVASDPLQPQFEQILFMLTQQYNATSGFIADDVGLPLAEIDADEEQLAESSLYWQLFPSYDNANDVYVVTTSASAQNLAIYFLINSFYGPLLACINSGATFDPTRIAWTRRALAHAFEPRGD